MSQELSPDARQTLIEVLERAIASPSRLRSFLKHLKPTTTPFEEGMTEDELSEVLDCLMRDPRRLELLSDEELVRLGGDPAALIALGDEVTHDWWLPWNGPLSAAGREFREQTGFRPPNWDEIEAELAKGTKEVQVEAGEFAAALGQVSEKEIPAGGRARLIHRDWNWTWEELAPDGVPGFGGPPGSERQLIELHLRAYARHGERPGGWTLSIGGVAPEDDKARLVVGFDGLGLRASDTTEGVALGRTPAEIDLTGLGDPTGLFEGQEEGAATLTFEVSGRHDWQAVATIYGPYLGRKIYDDWLAHPTDGLDCCVERLRRYLPKPIPDHDLLWDAVTDAMRSVYRKRYYYEKVTGIAAFSKCVLEAAKNRYIDLLRKERRRRDQATGGEFPFEPEDNSRPDDEPEDGDLRGRLETLKKLVERLPEAQRKVLHLWAEGLSFAEIANRLGTSEGAARVAKFRAHRTLIEWIGIDGIASDGPGLRR